MSSLPFDVYPNVAPVGDVGGLARALLESRGSYISGGRLARDLGISRSALWKRVNVLRRKGFLIEAAKGKGYRLVDTPELSAEEVSAGTNGALGSNIYFYDEAGSTNDIAMDLASRGARHGTVVLASEQSRGKGRLGRQWISPRGVNVYMSVVLRPGMQPRDAGLLTLAVGVACALAIREAAGVEASIKWPNDIMASGRKLGGILLEMRSEPDRVLYAVAGIGINVNMKVFPPRIRGAATSVLAETGLRHKPSVLAAAILDALDRELKALERGQRRGELLEKWKTLSGTLGRKVKATCGTEDITGEAVDVDEQGSLIIRSTHGMRKISSGDITMLR